MRDTPQTVTLRDVLLLLPNHDTATGGLRIENGKIAEIRRYPVADPERLVLPGLINCHSHAAMTLLRGRGSGLPLDRWLNEAIFPIEAKMKPADIEIGARLAAYEMVAGGTTSVADMYDFPASTAQGFAAVGLRSNLCRVGLAFADNVPPGRLEECIQFTRDFNALADPFAVADLCIHSEYLTNEKFCRALAEANREFRRPVHLHLSETEKEHRDCLARHGLTPAAFLASTGLLDYGGYAAHCVWCTDEDFTILREKGVALVHNPTSNLKLGSGIARIADARRLGVRVVLGTDGCASNDNVNLFEEMHLAALLQKGVHRDPTLLSAWDVLDMATKDAALALHRPMCGELREGFEADLCVMDLTRPHANPLSDPASLIVYSLQAADVIETYVAGRRVYDRATTFQSAEYRETLRAFKSAVASLNHV